MGSGLEPFDRANPKTTLNQIGKYESSQNNPSYFRLVKKIISN